MTEPLETTLATVVEPMLDRSLGDLGMIGDLSEKRFGSDQVQVLVPVPNYPLLDELERRIRDRIGDGPSLEFLAMTDEQRASMMDRIRQEAGPRVNESGSRTRVIMVSSGKGGVGKSSVTTNLAIALHRAGRSVGVIDADIWGFSIPRMLGIDHPPVVIEQSIVPPMAHGVKAMSMDYFVGDDQAVIWRGPMLHKAIEQFLQDVFWDGPDFLLIDTPPGTGDVSISLQQLIPRAQVLLVTTPQPTAQRVARRAGLMAEKMEQEVMGVVENMSWFTGDDGKRYVLFGEGGGALLAEEQGVPLMAQIPLVPAMRVGADEGVPVSIAAPDSEASAAFDTLAEAVVSRKPRVRTHPDLVIR